MDPSLLDVVAVFFNPNRWASRLRHYLPFQEHMLEAGVRLTVVECALGERPYEIPNDTRVNIVRVRTKTLTWNKENLINIGVRALPDTWKYVAWIDADVSFHNPKWAFDTVHALQQYPVVQPWSSALDLGPDGEPMCIKGVYVQTSFAKVWHNTGNIESWEKNLPTGSYGYPHPGYAWAMSRATYEHLGGLLETCGLGAADHQMAMALVGKIDRAVHGQTTKEYQDCVNAWGALAKTFVGGRIGYCTGMLSHKFHGAKDKRKYQERWDVLVKHKFNPHTDLKRNSYGVLELAGNKPEMEQDFDRYFRQRDEDANIL